MRTFSALNILLFSLICTLPALPSGCSTPIRLLPADPGMLAITIQEGVPLGKEDIYRRMQQTDHRLLIPEGCIIDLALTDYTPEKEVFSFMESGDAVVKYEIVPSTIRARARIIRQDKIIKTLYITATGHTRDELIDSCLAGLAGTIGSNR